MLLAMLLLVWLGGAVVGAALFRGRPGLYLRVGDWPALCPALSLAQPWPGPATSTVTVFQLSGGNSRLVLGEFEPPQPPVRAVPNGARPRCGLGRHCGPAAVTYSLLRLEVSRNIDYNYVMRRGSPADLMCRPVRGVVPTVNAVTWHGQA